jgi:hypothetical protein
VIDLCNWWLVVRKCKNVLSYLYLAFVVVAFIASWTTVRVNVAQLMNLEQTANEIHIDDPELDAEFEKLKHDFVEVKEANQRGSLKISTERVNESSTHSFKGEKSTREKREKSTKEKSTREMTLREKVQAKNLDTKLVTINTLKQETAQSLKLMMQAGGGEKEEASEEEEEEEVEEGIGRFKSTVSTERKSMKRGSLIGNLGATFTGNSQRKEKEAGGGRENGRESALSVSIDALTATFSRKKKDKSSAVVPVGGGEKSAGRDLGATKRRKKVDIKKKLHEKERALFGTGRAEAERGDGAQ